jgi:hypothetical protein
MRDAAVVGYVLYAVDVDWRPPFVIPEPPDCGKPTGNPVAS